MSTFNILILAGVRPEGDALALQSGVTSKALIRIGDSPMIERVVIALRCAGAGRIDVSTSDPLVAALARSLGCEVVRAGATPGESAVRAFRQIGAPMLVTTADHALLRPEWVRHFLAARASGTDMSIMLARRETVEQAAAGTRRTYLHFADGEYSGCNLFYLASPRAAAALDFWRLVEQDRKAPRRLVAKLGATFLLRYLFGRLSLAQAVGELSARIGLRTDIVESPFGLAAVDIDKPDDLAFARALDAIGQPRRRIRA